jgi:hypothetical protein
MIRNLLFCILILTSLLTYSQSDRINIRGKVISDFEAVEGVHIINKNSEKGTITNANGDFIISVHENDTLLISGVQFYFREILITRKIIIDKFITIDLLQKINELEEVEVKAHDLTGSLLFDAAAIKDTISKVAPSTLDFSMIDFGKPVIYDIDAMDRQKPPDISHLTNPHFQSGIGASISIGSIKKKSYLTIPDKIRSKLGDDFFTKTLELPVEQIEPFINYCLPKGIANLYLQNRKLEMIDVLFKARKNYNFE